MTKLSGWNLMQSLQASKRRGIIIGIIITILVIVALVAIIATKIYLFKKLGCFCCDCDDDYYFDSDDLDENGCAYTSEKDFV
jgi:flagellar basal body-associated protein FliL